MDGFLEALHAALGQGEAVIAQEPSASQPRSANATTNKVTGIVQDLSHNPAEMSSGDSSLKIPHDANVLQAATQVTLAGIFVAERRESGEV